MPISAFPGDSIYSEEYRSRLQLVQVAPSTSEPGSWESGRNLVDGSPGLSPGDQGWFLRDDEVIDALDHLGDVREVLPDERDPCRLAGERFDLLALPFLFSGDMARDMPVDSSRPSSADRGVESDDASCRWPTVPRQCCPLGQPGLRPARPAAHRCVGEQADMVRSGGAHIIQAVAAQGKSNAFRIPLVEPLKISRPLTGALFERPLRQPFACEVLRLHGAAFRPVRWEFARPSRPKPDPRGVSACCAAVLRS